LVTVVVVASPAILASASADIAAALACSAAVARVVSVAIAAVFIAIPEISCSPFLISVVLRIVVA